MIPAKYRAVLKRVIRKIYYFGLRHKCPLCKSHLRKLFPFGLAIPVLKKKKVVGGGCRSNACCPVCYSVDRERLIYLFLLYKTDIFKRPQTILHVAPEPRLSDTLRDKSSLDYLSADINSKDVMVRMDITKIEYPDCSFDSIICNHVLEHIVNDRKAMLELFRVLKPGGWAVLQVPLSMMLKQTHEDSEISTEKGREEAFGQSDHVRIYGKDYKDRLENAGFNVSVFHWANEAENFGGKSNRFGLNKDEVVYFACKHH